MAQKDNYNQKLLLFYFIYKNYNFVKKKVFQILLLLKYNLKHFFFTK